MADRASPIADVAWLAVHFGDPGCRIVELDVARATYDAGHIPGAVLWNAYSDLRGADYLPIAPEALAELLSRSGVTPDTTLVFCGYGAALGYWLMKSHRHDDVRVLDGSREQWAGAVGGLSTQEPAIPATAYALGLADAEMLCTRDEVQSAIADPQSVLLDVRSELEYDGERFWPSGATADAGRAGHIPGAIAVPIDVLRTVDEQLKPAGELRRIFDEAGLHAEQRVIVYCTIGNRASQVAFALSDLLGYPDVCVYYASWAEWGKAADTPIEV